MKVGCSDLVDKTQSFFQIKPVATTLLVITVAAAIIGAIALTNHHSFIGHIVGNAAGIIMTTCGTSAFTALLINLCCSCRRPNYVQEARTLAPIFSDVETNSFDVETNSFYGELEANPV